MSRKEKICGHEIHTTAEAVAARTMMNARVKTSHLCLDKGKSHNDDQRLEHPQPEIAEIVEQKIQDYLA